MLSSWRMYEMHLTLFLKVGCDIRRRKIDVVDFELLTIILFFPFQCAGLIPTCVDGVDCAVKRGKRVYI
jgi:hypothetical protein